MKKQLTGLFLAALLAVPHAQAGMISPAPQSERERVLAMVERPEVARELERMGIPAQEAKARVNAMTEAEVIGLAGKLDALPAGGALSNQDLLLVVIVILLVLVLL